MKTYFEFEGPVGTTNNINIYRDNVMVRSYKVSKPKNHNIIMEFIFANGNFIETLNETIIKKLNK